MVGFGSPCGACKFLRRKCVRGCVFAPYFCHDQGAALFEAIHKVFGASNFSKLLLHLPASQRSEAALTVSYEAQARLQDPIYCCVAHIFALQQQVVTLEAQIESLKAQTAQSYSFEEDELRNKLPQHNNTMNPEVMLHLEDVLLDSNSFQSSQHSYTSYDNQFLFTTDDNSWCTMSTSFDLQANAMRSTSHDMDDLHSVAFGYLNCA
ncbi:LOB domain-containing protein CRL1-like [Curcuma longa]|uniref:LOB domain-containing protein CRL1-like n=1 Tax=Curcuma longa TaxID=136217 RepID=UPI003D9ED343